MASLFSGEEILVCTSGSSFVVLSQSGQVLYRETRRRPGQLSGSTTTQEKGSATDDSKPAAEPSEDSTGQEGDSSHSPTGKILACRFSPSGRYFALCDDYKTLSLYETDGWNLLSTSPTSKRCMAVAFNHTEDTVYVADKFGDVHSFSVRQPSSEGSLILGHLSMLLDMVVSPDDRFILTADRDEKIRVSCLPNAYSIHAFCLGHTEFVSRIAILPRLDSVLVTGGGDCTLRFWDYRQGKELQCVPLQPPGPTSSEDKRIISGITCCAQHGLLAVTVLGSSSVLIFHTSTESGSLQVKQSSSLDVQAVCWSACFDGQGRLWVLRQLESQPLAVYSVTESGEDYSLQPTSSSEENSNVASIVNELNKDWSFFEEAVSTPSPYINLYKRSFDNTQAYLERKEQRIRDQQEKKSGRRNKSHGSPAGKRARLKEDEETTESCQ